MSEKDPFERVCQPQNGFTLHGDWRSELYGPDGKLKEVHEKSNVVVTVGKDWLAQFLNSAAAAATTFTLRYMAIGTDSTSESAANTSLGIEVSRHTGTVSYVTSQIYQVKATFATGSGTGAIVEYGLYNTNTGGTLFCRAVDSVINKGASDTLTVTAQISIS
jgi:hypothetical protein